MSRMKIVKRVVVWLETWSYNKLLRQSLWVAYAALVDVCTNLVMAKEKHCSGGMLWMWSSDCWENQSFKNPKSEALYAGPVPFGESKQILVRNITKQSILV